MAENRKAGDPPSSLLADRAWLPPDWPLHVGVALSGGADSVALLKMLQEWKQHETGTGQLYAFHVNHQLRGDASDTDARWCEQLCEAMGVPLQVLTCDTTQYAAQQGEGIEAAARAQRYRLLTAAAEQVGVRYLATAHTRDDQVETVLFRLLRGTGLRGLAGIPRSRALTPSLTLIRPLLSASRADLIAYLAERGQDFRIDVSNTDKQFTRNRIRHELLPLLRDNYNSDFDAALSRLAMQAGETQHFIEHEAWQLLEEARATTEPQATALNCAAFADRDFLLVREALRIAWREAGLAEQAMSFERWNALAGMAVRASDGAVLNLPGNVRASVAGGILRLEK